MTETTPPADDRKLIQVLVETKNFQEVYEVENGFQAVKSFFRDIIENKVSLADVGLIGFWNRADGEKIPFRIPPALFAANLIPESTLMANLQQIAPFSKKQAMELVKADSWMVQP